MGRRRSFSADWKNISDKQVEENIKYLFEHYKECSIYKYNDSHISIDNVDIRKRDGVGFRGNYKYYWVNKKCYDELTNSSMCVLLQQLCDACGEEFDAQTLKKEKINQGVSVAVSGILIVVLLWWAAHRIVKQGKIENQIKTYEQSLPNYKEYEQVKAQIANYRDSLENKRR